MKPSQFPIGGRFFMIFRGFWCFLCFVVVFLPLFENANVRAAGDQDKELFAMIRVTSKWEWFEGRNSKGEYGYRIIGSATAYITGRLKLTRKTSLHKSYSTQELEVAYTYTEKKLDLRPRPDCPELVWILTAKSSGTITRKSKLKAYFRRKHRKGKSKDTWLPDYRFHCPSVQGIILGKVREHQWSNGCRKYKKLSRQVNFGGSYIEADYDSSGEMRGGYSWDGGYPALDITNIGPNFRKDRRLRDMPPVKNGKASEKVSWRFSKTPILLILQKERGEWIDITDPPNPPQPKMVGEKIELRGAVFPEEKDPKKGEWSISGNVIEDFVVKGETGHVDKLEKNELNKPEIKFYWWDAKKDATVKYSSIVAGKKLQAKADFIIKEPGIRMDIKVPDGAFGIKEEKGTNELQYITKEDVTIFFAHGPLPPEFAGKTQYVQLVDTSGVCYKYRDSPTPLCLEYKEEGLDKDYPYSQGPKTNDTPGVVVTYLDLTISVSYNYKMYLMYKPQREGAIFVPLRVADWKWNGLAKRETIHDNFDFHGSTMTKTPREREAIKYPEWDWICRREKVVWDPCK